MKCQFSVHFEIWPFHLFGQNFYVLDCVYLFSEEEGSSSSEKGCYCRRSEMQSLMAPCLFVCSSEEAVNEVKRQAMSELQKAVSDAERKAHEMISAERSKMERALAEAKRQASEDALTVINQQEDSSEVRVKHIYPNPPSVFKEWC